MNFFNLLSIILIFGMTVMAMIYPFLQHRVNPNHELLKIGEPLAAGVFLGASLLHMLSEAASQFEAQHIGYPWPFLIAGSIFLLFLYLEHLCREFYHHRSQQAFAVVAICMMSLHGFFAGAALGISHSATNATVILCAILAHKWAESFALATQVQKSMLQKNIGLMLLGLFACMTPLGIITGAVTNHVLHGHPILEPSLTALAAGTFLYFGTLHGLERSTLIKQCCNLKYFYYVICGFSVMALVAIWT